MISSHQIHTLALKTFPFSNTVGKDGLVVAEVHAVFSHSLAAVFTVTDWPGVADVVPKSINRIELADLLRLRQNQRQILATGAEKLPGCERTRVVRLSVRIPFP